MKKKVVSQDNQLQAFITQIIERKNQMNFIKLKKVMRTKNISQNTQTQESIMEKSS